MRTSGEMHRGYVFIRSSARQSRATRSRSARFLLGKILVRRLPAGAAMMGRIVETEAYLRRRSRVSRVSRHDAAQSFAVPRGRTRLCVSVLRHFVSAQRVERTAGYGRRCPAARARAVVGNRAHAAIARSGGGARDLARGPGRLTAALAGRSPARRHRPVSPRTFVDRQRRQRRSTPSARARASASPRAPTHVLRYFVAGSGYLSGTRRLNA